MSGVCVLYSVQCFAPFARGLCGRVGVQVWLNQLPLSMSQLVQVVLLRGAAEQQARSGRC